VDVSVILYLFICALLLVVNRCWLALSFKKQIVLSLKLGTAESFTIGKTVSRLFHIDTYKVPANYSKEKNMRMYGWKKYCLLILCLGATKSTFAREFTVEELALSKEKILSAIVKFEKTKRKHWSYVVTRYENEEGDITSSIEQYSPSNNTAWQLKKINGEQPTTKQVKKFAKQKQKQASTKTQAGNTSLKLRKLINQESLSLVSIDDKRIVMGFNVRVKKFGKDAMDKLQGQLTYQLDAKFIEQISIWNNASFSPMLTANITDLALTFTFVEINGAVLTKENKMSMKGSFAYFTEINETSLDSFSDYQYQEKIID